MKKWVWTLCVGILVVGSFAPTLYELGIKNRLRPDREFELVHNFYTDYNFYLSRIREGLEGRWTAVERYTSEPHQGSLIHVFYVFLGQVGRWVRVPWHRAGDVYHMARLVFAAALLFQIVQFCRMMFTREKQHWALLAFLLAVTAGSWPTLVFFNGGWRLGGYMSWWSLMDTLQRITFIPHILVGQAILLFLVVQLGRKSIREHPANWIFLGGLAFVLGIVFPPGVVFLGAMLAVGAALELVWARVGRNVPVGKWAVWTVLPYVVVLAFALPAMLYLNLVTSFYPWKRLTEFDIINPLPFAYLEYIKALGPILPLGLAGMVVALVKKERRLLFAIAWVVAWVVLLIVFRFIPQQSPLRFSEVLPHVPLAALAVYLFWTLFQRPRGKFVLLVPAALLLIGVGQMYSSFLWQRDFVDHKIRATQPLVPTGSYVMYPLKDFVAAIRFIQDAAPRDTVVLSETTAGNYIPVIAGNTVYVGHANTVKAEEKKARVVQFFRGRMNPAEAQTWMRQDRIGLVFFGPQEREEAGIEDLSLVYPFLTQAFTNTYVRVYQVR
jgi:hypothetical protein